MLEIAPMLAKVFKVIGICIRTSIIPYMINNNKTAADRDTHARLVSRVFSQTARELGAQQGLLTGVAFGTVAGVLRSDIHQFMTDSPSNVCERARSGFDQGMRQFIDGMSWIPLIKAQLVTENSQIWLEQLCNGQTNNNSWVMDSTIIMSINAATHKFTSYSIIAIVSSPVSSLGLIAVELSDIVILTVAYDSNLTIAQKALTLGSGVAVTALTSFTAITGLLAVGAGLTATVSIYCGFKSLDKCAEQSVEIAEASYGTVQNLYERIHDIANIVGDNFKYPHDLSWTY